MDSFETIMTIPVAKESVTRWFPGRITARVDLSEGKAVYLKRYESNYLSTSRRVLRAVNWPTARDEAKREWDAMHELRAAGIVTPTPVAMGQERSFGIVTRSFVMTEEIYGGVQADRYVASLGRKERRILGVKIAELAQRFHGLGYVHKDFYLCHFFVVGKTKEIYLIDLQRVTKPRLFRERWLVKDLGGLAYSALEAGFSNRELVRFYKAYSGKRRLDDVDRRLLGKIQRRIERFRRHEPRHPNRAPDEVR